MTPSPLVLAYHAVDAQWRNALCVTPDQLRSQLHALASRGYRGVTFSEAAHRPSAGLVAITFDDGLASAAREAPPILAELGWPGTAFLATEPTTSGTPMTWLSDVGDGDQVRAMSWDDASRLAAAGWELGSHTRTHRLLSRLDPADAERELRSSRAEIEERLGECKAISYPWGEVDDRIVELARAAGYTSGSGLSGRFTFGDPMRVPRFAITAGDAGVRFRLKTAPAFWRLRGSVAWEALDAARGRRGGWRPK